MLVALTRAGLRAKLEAQSSVSDWHYQPSVAVKPTTPSAICDPEPGLPRRRLRHDWIATLEKLKAVEFDTVLPGHGYAFTGKAKINIGRVA